MRSGKIILVILTVFLAACGGPLHIAYDRYEAPERPVFHAEKIDKFKMRNMPAGEPVILDYRLSAWVSSGGEILVFDHGKNKEVNHITGKYDIGQMSFDDRSFYWIEVDRDKHHIVRYDIREDDELWRHQCPSTVVDPIISDSSVIVIGTDGEIVARDIADGDELWRKSLKERVFVQPVKDENAFYVITDTGTLYSIGMMTGGVRWKKRLKQICLTQAVHAGMLYLGTFDGTMLQFDVAKQEIRWSIPTEHQVRNAPLIDQDTVIWLNSGGTIYEIDRQTGKYLQLAELHTPVAGTPAVTEQGYLISGMDNTLYHVDFSGGGFLNTLELSGRLRSSPFYFRDRWYVTMEDWWIYALR